MTHKPQDGHCKHGHIHSAKGIVGLRCAESAIMSELRVALVCHVVYPAHTIAQLDQGTRTLKQSTV